MVVLHGYQRLIQHAQIAGILIKILFIIQFLQSQFTDFNFVHVKQMINTCTCNCTCTCTFEVYFQKLMK